ncbi:MAG: dephospho-CoA kinase [Candidatus Omnitrophica bacterium]|nr:dephospho-CoA kinase [Candidatus Omnitrophota bacterium]
MKKKLLVGITGGLASGKTLVSGLFEAKGAFRIDADKIAHELLAKDKKINKKIMDIFGEGVFDNAQINRKKLAKEVFFNAENLERLCGVLHPPIIGHIKKMVKTSKKKVIIIDAPLLIETGLDKFVDIVVVVAAKREKQIDRAIKRGMTWTQAEKVIRTQMPLCEKVKCAHYIIENNGRVENLKKGVDALWRKWQGTKKN